jgi:hypothetical protein
MRKPLLAALLLLAAVPASAQVPVAPPSAAPSAEAPKSAPGPVTPTTVPTYWVMMVTGEKDGVPWIKTNTPETLGGAVKDTGPWKCTYPPTERGTEGGTSYERNEVACSVGDAEVFVSLRCDFRNKAKAGKAPGKAWKRSELQTLNLRRKGDSKSTVTVSLRCDIDAAYAIES